MKAISEHDHPRLHRIQKISRIVKIAVVFYIVVPTMGFLFWEKLRPSATVSSVSVLGKSFSSFAEVPVKLWILGGVGQAFYLFGAFSLYRLLGLYQKGIIFSGENTLQLRRIGTALIGYGLFGVTASVVTTGALIFPLIFMSTIGSPWLIAGAATYIVAWIMDEGRKMREEQALTV